MTDTAVPVGKYSMAGGCRMQMEISSCLASDSHAKTAHGHVRV